MTRYTVCYTRQTNGEIEVEASSPAEAQQIVERYSWTNFGVAREYDEPIDCYDVTESK